MIFKEFATANLFFLLIAFILGGNSFLTIFIVDVLACFYKILTNTVLKISIQNDEMSILKFKFFKFSSINVELIDVKVYFIERALGRGSPANVLVFENNDSSIIAEIPDFFSGFNLDRLKEIHKYITERKVTNGSEQDSNI